MDPGIWVNIYELGNEDNNSTDSKDIQHQENGSVSGSSDTEHTVELNGDVGSPNGSISKEDGHTDDASLDGRVSSSPTLQSEDMKLNGSVSSRGSSPAPDSDTPPRACIVRAVSIEAASNQPSSSIGMMTTALAISLTNGTTVSSQ